MMGALLRNFPSGAAAAEKWCGTKKRRVIQDYGGARVQAEPLLGRLEATSVIPPHVLRLPRSLLPVSVLETSMTSTLQIRKQQ